jgi:hypothetical protein
MTKEANRLRAHAVVMSSPATGYRSNALEVSYARAEQLFVPRYNITVTKHSLDLFLAEFKLPTEEDHALCKGSIDIGGSSFLINP